MPYKDFGIPFQAKDNKIYFLARVDPWEYETMLIQYDPEKDECLEYVDLNDEPVHLEINHQ